MSENPAYSLLKIIHRWFWPERPLDDKVDWKSYNKVRDYCDEEIFTVSLKKLRNQAGNALGISSILDGCWLADEVNLILDDGNAKSEEIKSAMEYILKYGAKKVVCGRKFKEYSCTRCSLVFRVPADKGPQECPGCKSWDIKEL